MTLDLQKLRIDVDELATQNEKICKRFDVGSVAFRPHFDGINCLHLVRLIVEASEYGYLSHVHFGNKKTLFATFVTDEEHEFVIGTDL